MTTDLHSLILHAVSHAAKTGIVDAIKLAVLLYCFIFPFWLWHHLAKR